jgi:hypothetical protein
MVVDVGDTRGDLHTAARQQKNRRKPRRTWISSPATVLSLSPQPQRSRSAALA